MGDDRRDDERDDLAAAVAQGEPRRAADELRSSPTRPAVEEAVEKRDYLRAPVPPGWTLRDVLRFTSASTSGCEATLSMHDTVTTQGPLPGAATRSGAGQPH